MSEEFQPRRVISIVVIGVIAFIFAINWGPGSRGCESGRPAETATNAALVNGKEISLRDFNRAYQGQLQMYRNQGMPIPDSLAKQVGLPKQVLEQLVNSELWAQAADRNGVAASDEELAELIRNNPDFQKDGAFNMDSYNDALTNYYRKTIPEYEADLRRRLAAFKMQELVGNQATVSDDEVKARFLKDGNKAQITYVRFLPSFYADKVPAPTPAEVTAYKQAHKKEIEDFYNANKASYEQPEKVRARHILVKVDRGAAEDKKNEAKKKLEDLRKQIVDGGKDFAAVAKDVSEDLGSKPTGGDLGLQDRQAWVPEFANSAFSLKPGEVSQPVETQFGFHLIKAEEKKASEKKELKDVEDEIARNLVKQEKAKALARADADKALAAARGGGKLATLFPPEKEGQPAVKRFQTETKAEAVQTDEFSSSGGSIPNLGAAPEVTAAVFAVQGPQLLDRVFQVNDSFVVVNVDVRKLANDEEFAKEKDKLRAEAVRAKQVEVRESYLKALKKDGQVKMNEDAINNAVGS
jgi:peptidyl-prolyl cis-trans isomerase D